MTSTTSNEIAGKLATYARIGNVGVIRLDDGKVNAMSPTMQEHIHAALDEAESDGVVVVVTGRPGILSAGFDLQVLSTGSESAASMVTGGFELAYRLLSFPRPVVIACPGHAIAMGVFLLLCGDYRIGPSTPAKYNANEVAIGLTMPRAALEVLRQRLTPAAFVRAAFLSEVFTSENAVEAGFLDRNVPPSVEPSDAELSAKELALQSVVHAAIEEGERLATLNRTAFTNTKARARQSLLAALRMAIDDDARELSQLLSG